ncbi:MAG: hypothetical protein HY060_05815 [Proteobacteria bacterium]|nr:hypothetical protein [Pseudomonadota bacterium]
MRCLKLSLAMLLLPLPGLAAEKDVEYVTERGRLMCTSPQSLNEAQRAVEARDKPWLDSIKECTQSRPGLKAEIMQGGMLTAKIKVYDEAGKWTIYWTSPTTVKEVRR